jgi:AraC-like DNA-binding protein
MGLAIINKMKLREILPSQPLKPYLKGFYLYESQLGLPFDDIVFPSGNMELIFNLGEGIWKTKKDDSFYPTPMIEFWGQLTKPLAIQSVGSNTMLGIRFYSHSAAYFFNEDVSVFNNEIRDATDLFGASIGSLHASLLGHLDLRSRIALIETYLLKRIAISEKKHAKIKFIGEIAASLQKHCHHEKIVSISVRNHISSRYLTQLFSQYTGLPPKLYCKINRFQHSLYLINHKQKLTSIAYDSGYFDQSHFIKEFKLFTGITPTSFATQALPINQMLASN